MSFLTDADHARVTRLYRRAVHALDVGHVADSIDLLREALVIGVHSAPVLDCLGMALCKIDRPQAAIVCHRRATLIDPLQAEYFYTLGNALQTAQLQTAASAAYASALRLRPEFAEAHNNLGSLAARAGRLNDAVQSFRLALALDADYAVARLNLGNALRDLGNPAGAEGCFRAILAANPEADEARFGLANALAAQRKVEPAIAAFRLLLARRPDWLDGLNNLATLLNDEARLAPNALAMFRRIVAASPQRAEGHTNLGNILREEGRMAEALTAQRRALALKPAYATAISNLGGALYQDGNVAGAIAAYRRALHVEPEMTAVRFNLAIALLAAGHWEQGWRHYEDRWKHHHLKPRAFARPMWRDQPLEGQRIVVHAEQGFGDTVQFCRYASLLAGKGAKVILSVPRTLVRLLATTPGITQCLDESDPLPPYDLHIPLMSLPERLGTTPDAVPAAIPYLFPASELRQAWRDRLSPLAGSKIGLVWAGDPRPHDREAAAVDRRRSLPLDVLRPLLALSGVHFLSLQKGPAAGQLARLPTDLRPGDVASALHDFADTAALVSVLDLVIAVDTAIVHVAGALGKPVWILSRFDGCWRWLGDRDDTPWYPSARLFRQTTAGDWAGVVDRVRVSLLSEGYAR